MAVVCPTSPNASCESIENAIYYGHLHCVRKFHEVDGHLFHNSATADAVVYDSIEVLDYLMQHGASWHPMTANWAAFNGALKCLQHIYENYGHLATWCGTYLEDFESNPQTQVYPEVCDYLRSVQESWQRGDNDKTRVFLKPAKK